MQMHGYSYLIHTLFNIFLNKTGTNTNVAWFLSQIAKVSIFLQVQSKIFLGLYSFILYLYRLEID